MKRPTFLRTAAVAVATTLALVGCTGTSGTNGSGGSGGGAANGMIDYLDYGDFGGGTAPQANYNPFLEATRLGATDYLFEKLMVFDNFSCTPKPWLATEYKWTDPKTLTYKLREGVKWNDGKPFSSKDVAYTFDLLHKHSALDVKGIWRYLSSVEAPDANTFTLHFKAPGASTFTLVNDVYIVPEHIWSQQADPVKFVNAQNPVGTGPMKVKAFNPQQLSLERNPDYWQADKVKVQELRFHKADSGGAVEQLKLSRGEYDTNAMFVPDIKKAFVDRDPEHNHYWYPPGGSISIYMNLTKAPFNDVAFRKALTTAFNRDEIVTKSQLGYVEKASQTGLVVPGQDKWLPEGLQDQGRIGYDSAAADSALTAAGYQKDSQGRRLGKDGRPIKFTFKVPGSFTDWVSAARIVVTNLKGLGFDVATEAPNPATYESDRAVGRYDMLFGVHGGSCNMFRNFSEPLGSDQSAPIGQKAASNFVRWNDPATDKLLDELRLATSDEDQKKAVAGLTKVMVDQVPMIPLWYGAKWFQYQTDKAVGWPDEKNPYAAPGDNVLVLTSLKPAGS